MRVLPTATALSTLGLLAAGVASTSKVNAALSCKNVMLWNVGPEEQATGAMRARDTDEDYQH